MPNPFRHLFRRDSFWPFAIALLIFIASSRARVASIDVPDSDKLAHFAVFGLLATLLCRIGSGWRAALWAFLATSLFGASDEWHQSFVPGRTAQVSDWVADTLGAALAVVMFTAWPWYRQLLERPLWSRRSVEGREPLPRPSRP